MKNHFPDDLKASIKKLIDALKEANVKLLGYISNNEEITKIKLMDGNLREISNVNPSYQQANENFSKII